MPQKWQKRARPLTRAMQPGQIVSRSRSCRVSSAPQKRQAPELPSSRGAPQEEQRTTAASWAAGGGTVTSAPQEQGNVEPTRRSVASNWRWHAGQATR